MGEAFLCRRGGGSPGVTESAYALLCVRFPAGSACACENGGESHALADGEGLAAFAVESGGTWTVTISDGTCVKSGSVTLQSGAVKTLTLAYDEQPADARVLLSPEGGLAAGYTLVGNAAMDETAIRETGSGGFYLSPAVDLSAYTTLTVVGTLRVGTYTYSRIGADADPERVLESYPGPEAGLAWEGAFGTEYTAALDIAALEGEYYIGTMRGSNQLEITGIVLS